MWRAPFGRGLQSVQRVAQSERGACQWHGFSLSPQPDAEGTVQQRPAVAVRPREAIGLPNYRATWELTTAMGSRCLERASRPLDLLNGGDADAVTAAGAASMP